LKAYDLARELREKKTPVISGFHTPVEKDMLEILLKGKGPNVICPARGWRECAFRSFGVKQSSKTGCCCYPCLINLPIELRKKPRISATYWLLVWQTSEYLFTLSRVEIQKKWRYCSQNPC